MRAILLSSAAAAALLATAAVAQQSPASPPAPPTGDIVVTANAIGVAVDNTPSITARVDRNAILEAGGASIADALADVPGISASGFATGASRPIIRGMDATRVRTLEDGSSSSDVSDIGPDHGVPIDPLAARSIEVVRGAATLRYGSQATGGVVNVINDRVPLHLPETAFGGELTGSYDSVADTGQGSAMLDGKVGDVAVHADGFYRNAGDYDTPDGRQANSFFRGYGETVGGSYFFGPEDRSRIGAAIIQYNAKYGIPSDTTFIDMKQTKVLSRGSLDLGSGLLEALTADFSYADYSHNETEPDGTIDTTFNNKEYDGRAELVLKAAGSAQNSAVGVEVQHRNFSAVGEDASYLFPTVTQTEAGYAFAELPVTAALRLQASGRVEHVEVDGTPRFGGYTRDGFTPLSAAVGALWDVGPVKLGLTAASTGRAPAQTELFARGGHDGPDTFETGDPDLGIERANSLEATLRVRRDRFRFDGSLYSTWFHNYIYGDLTGRTCDDDGTCTAGGDGDLRELNYRQGGAHFRGAEGEASYRLLRTAGGGALTLRGLADYTRATLKGGGNVPRIPPYRAGGGLGWESRPVDASVLLLHSGRQDRPGAFDTDTPGFNELNAQVAVRPFSKHQGVELALVGQNLTNDVQRDAAAFNKDVVEQPGRNVRVVLRIATP